MKKTKAPNKRVVSTSLTPHQFDALTKEAERKQSSVSELVRGILGHHPHLFAPGNERFVLVFGSNAGGDDRPCRVLDVTDGSTAEVAWGPK